MVDPKINEFFKDQDFIDRVLNAHSEDELIALFKEKGIEITPEDIKASMNPDNLETVGDFELSADQLEQVAGGSFWSDFKEGFKAGFTHPFQSIAWLLDKNREY